MARAGLGLLAFLGTTAIGVALAYFVIRAVPPTFLDPTATCDGCGEGLVRFGWFCVFGFASLVVGIAVGMHVSRADDPHAR